MAGCFTKELGSVALLVRLLFLPWAIVTGADVSSAVGGAQLAALAAARALVSPKPSLSKGGEFEGHEFWEEHDSLLSRAWQELGPRNEDLYVYGPAFEQRYMHSSARSASTEARAGQGEEAAKALFAEVVPGVFASDRLFTQEFLADVLSELEHIEASGIPQRRPNGMNRYGVILDNVGLQRALEGLVAAYVRPLAGMLFPELVGADDAVEHYAFTVRYEPSGDTELVKHGDASVVTMNLCLGRPGWRGGDLQFFDYEASGMYSLPPGSAAGGAGNVTFRPGLVVLHRGQHKHQALPLLSGERTNIILWLFARHGVVRVAPYKKKDWLTAGQRWNGSGLVHGSDDSLRAAVQDEATTEDTSDEL